MLVVKVDVVRLEAFERALKSAYLIYEGVEIAPFPCFPSGLHVPVGSEKDLRTTAGLFEPLNNGELSCKLKSEQ